MLKRRNQYQTNGILVLKHERSTRSPIGNQVDGLQPASSTRVAYVYTVICYVSLEYTADVWILIDFFIANTSKNTCSVLINRWDGGGARSHRLKLDIECRIGVKRWKIYIDELVWIKSLLYLYMMTHKSLMIWCWKISTTFLTVVRFPSCSHPMN